MTTLTIDGAPVAVVQDCPVCNGDCSGANPPMGYACPLERQRAMLAAMVEMRGALAAMTKRYVELVNSGDCGHWNVEHEDDVKRARAALARVEVSR